MGAQIAGVITNDLADCGLFRPIEQAAFIRGRVRRGGAAQFHELEGDRRAGAGHRQRSTASGGTVRVEFRLWDVLPQHADPGHRLHHHARPTGAASPTSSPT